MKSYIFAAYPLFNRNTHGVSMARATVSIPNRIIPTDSSSNHYSTIHRSVNSEAEQFFNSLG